MKMEILWCAVEPEKHRIIGLAEREFKIVAVELSKKEWFSFKKENYIFAGGMWCWNFHGENGESEYIKFEQCKQVDENHFIAEAWYRGCLED